MISTQHLTLMMKKQYLCRDLNLQVQPGEMWAILGKNGVGKTTLLHTLAGLRHPESGKVLIDGTPIETLKAKIRAQKIAILLQENNYQFPFTVKELVSQARFPYQPPWIGTNRKDKDIVNQALLDLDLTELVNRTITELSGGEQQRVRIACLLAQTPEIYLFDEPTTYLDFKIQIKLLKKLNRIAKQEKKIVIQVLHDPNLAIGHCDKLLLLFDDGRILATTSEEMNAHTLEELYQIPFSPVSTDNRIYWLPT